MIIKENEELKYQDFIVDYPKEDPPIRVIDWVNKNKKKMDIINISTLCCRTGEYGTRVYYKIRKK